MIAVALKLGASGIFSKLENPDQLRHAINLVAKGGVWRPEMSGEAPGRLLTDRQNKVLLGISRGLTNKKIGENLGLSEGSIKSVVQQLFMKAGVANAESTRASSA